MADPQHLTISRGFMEGHQDIQIAFLILLLAHIGSENAKAGNFVTLIDNGIKPPEILKQFA